MEKKYKVAVMLSFIPAFINIAVLAYGFFNFTDPQTLESAEFRFTDDYTEHSAGGFFEVTLPLERL